jgi:phospholipase/carboxylesterase
MRGAGALLATGALLAAAGCVTSAERTVSGSTRVGEVPAPRLDVELHDGAGRCQPGTVQLDADKPQPIRLRVTKEGGGTPRTLIVSLHGAGGSAKGGLWIFRAATTKPGVVVVAPASSGRGWDPQQDADVVVVERAIRLASTRCSIDRARIAIGGFSAGATYALLLGLRNGDLFHSVIALSPGGVLPGKRIGHPRVFIAHGRNDDVIPIDAGGGAVVPVLRRQGYGVTYRRFDDGHAVPAQISAAATRWWLGNR